MKRLVPGPSSSGDRKRAAVGHARGPIPTAAPQRGGGGADALGRIVRFDHVKGFGFIEVPGSEDVFFLVSMLQPPELQDIARRSGDIIGAEVEVGIGFKDGKPRATRVHALHPPGGGRPPMPPGWGLPPTPGPPPPGGPMHLPPGMKHGTIRKFEKQKGYGFIATEGIKDVFFLPSSLPEEMRHNLDNLAGMDVAFEIYMNEEGKPRARNIQPMGHSMGGPPPGMMGAPHMMPHMMMGMMNQMQQMMGGPMGMPGGPGMDSGTIRSFDSVKGFGFILPDNGPEDVFFLKGELAPDIKDLNKEALVGKRVEFEVQTMPDGKFRARRVEPLGAGGAGGGPRGGRRCNGRIRTFDKGKGYGFISSPEAGDRIFFLRSSLPDDIRESDGADLEDMEVNFEMGTNEQGKPRASLIQVGTGGASSGRSSNVQDGDVLEGDIVRFEGKKGFGFINSDASDEDIFFMRSEMPPELADAKNHDDVQRRRVEFEVKVMPDGKLRALSLKLLEGLAEPRPEKGGKSVDSNLLAEMEDWLAQKGGGSDFGTFSSVFRGVKKSQLTEFFEITDTDGHAGGRQRIELPPGHARRPEGGVSAVSDLGSASADMPMDADPPMKLGPGCRVHGVIQSYDAAAGKGLIRCEGLEEEVVFERTALPQNYRSKTQHALPDLVGVEVGLDMKHKEESTGGPRKANNVHVLLRWDMLDNCFRLRREL